MSMPSFFSGRSMMWPTVARTRYPRPRYLPIVLALAGDSTITSEVVPAAGGGPSSSSGAALRPRAAVFLAVFAAPLPVVFAAAPAVFFAADVARLDPDFLAAIGLSVRSGNPRRRP